MIKVKDYNKLKSFGFKKEEDNEKQYYLPLKRCDVHSGVGILINPNDSAFSDGELSFHAEDLVDTTSEGGIYEGLDECVKLDVLFEMLKSGAISYIDSKGKQYNLVES